MQSLIENTVGRCKTNSSAEIFLLFFFHSFNFGPAAIICVVAKSGVLRQSVAPHRDSVPFPFTGRLAQSGHAVVTGCVSEKGGQ